jgi:sugar phosphate isomerase/epimerase
MAIRSVGINQPWSCPNGLFGFAGDLESLKGCGADFVELMPAELGVILGGDLELARLRIVQELLLEADLAYTVHAPLEVNLMDLSAYEAQRRVLEATIRFAGRVGAGVVVCHAGQRIGPRDARHSLRQQLAAERLALRQAGDIAGELGVTIAVENYYPELPVVRGAVYDYSVWPSELAEQISAVDHLAVGICLDVGHAALASEVFGFDYVEECATIAPLVRHVHLHDNLQKTNLTGEPPVSEHPVYGLGDLHLPRGGGPSRSKTSSNGCTSPATPHAVWSYARGITPWRRRPFRPPENSQKRLSGDGSLLNAGHPKRDTEPPCETMGHAKSLREGPSGRGLPA